MPPTVPVARACCWSWHLQYSRVAARPTDDLLTNWLAGSTAAGYSRRCQNKTPARASVPLCAPRVTSSSSLADVTPRVGSCPQLRSGTTRSGTARCLRRSQAGRPCQRRSLRTVLQWPWGQPSPDLTARCRHSLQIAPGSQCVHERGRESSHC